MNNEQQAVADALTLYFDGLYGSDIDKLAKIFHPRAHYVCVTDGSLQYLTMAEYFPIVKVRPAPRDSGEPRRDKIISIKLAGPATAFAHVECAIGPKFFTDFLTLIFIDEKWQIISKVFHYEILSSKVRDN